MQNFHFCVLDFCYVFFKKETVSPKLFFPSSSLKIASPGSKECKTDFVKVMDGDCVSRLGESKFCGNDIPSKFESTTNRLCVKFFSDDSQNDQGFSASYNAISFNSQQIGNLFHFNSFLLFLAH